MSGLPLLYRLLAFGNRQPSVRAFCVFSTPSLKIDATNIFVGVAIGYCQEWLTANSKMPNFARKAWKQTIEKCQRRLYHKTRNASNGIENRTYRNQEWTRPSAISRKKVDIFRNIGIIVKTFSVKICFPILCGR